MMSEQTDLYLANQRISALEQRVAKLESAIKKHRKECEFFPNPDTALADTILWGSVVQ